MRTTLFSLLAIGSLALSVPAGGQMAATYCKDGSTSAASGRGACSDHGGIDKPRTKAAKKAVKREAKAVVKEAKAAGTMVTCSDGSSSNPGRGACSHHGGVKLGAPVAVPAPMPAPRPMPASPATRATRATPATPATPASSTAPARPATPATPAMPASPSRGTAPMNPSSRRGEDNDPTGAIAQCKDGMYSHSSNRRGACSRHQGVAKWMQM